MFAAFVAACLCACYLLRIVCFVVCVCLLVSVFVLLMFWLILILDYSFVYWCLTIVYECLFGLLIGWLFCF